MAEDHRGAQILQELEALSETMFQAHTTTRRTASLALPRTAVPPLIAPDEITHVNKDDQLHLNLNPKPRSRRMSLSPWRSRPKPDATEPETIKASSAQKSSSKWSDEEPTSSSIAEKKGIWKWKPIRALSHITMQKLSCLFSIEVVTVQNLPASMNGLRLSVCVRKKESKDGLVQTMPSRVSQMAADFEETLFVRCHVYFSPAGGGAQMKFEPRPFLIYVVAVDAEELDFGRSTVDLSRLIQESIDKNLEGSRVRQWDTTLKLLGKAKGGELVLKLGFQIMEKDGGVGIYTQAEGQRSKKSPSVARKQSKSSFSVPSPRMKNWTTPSSQKLDDDRLQGMDDLNLDEPSPDPAPEKKKAEEPKIEDIDLPDFDVVDKGVEIQEEEEQSEVNSDKRSVLSEVVKEVVQDESHVMRMSELDSIAQQIKALESMMGKAQKDEEEEEVVEETGSSQALDADEDKVTREFLQMLEVDDDNDVKAKIISPTKAIEKYNKDDDAKEETFLPDLGKGLGCIVQTRDGGYLAAMNPLDTIVDRKERPKLAMQMSKPMVIESEKTGLEFLQKVAAMGADKMASEMTSLMAMDDLIGKTAEQIAFEGIASAIIHGRNKEGATSSAARTIAALKSMVSALNNGRKERVSTGIWNVSNEPLTPEEILPFSMQKVESMAIEALKIQADVSEEEAPFDISPLVDDDEKTVLASAIPIEDWIKVKEKTITMAMIVQLRDPIRQYEGVGGPMVGLIHATLVDEELYGEEKRYKVGSVQVGGVKGSKHGWDTEKQKLTALQWLVANGMGKGAGKKAKRVVSKGPSVLWSLSSRIMADMWLKPIRNPDVKFNTK